jgi:hypothetical protein
MCIVGSKVRGSRQKQDSRDVLRFPPVGQCPMSVSFCLPEAIEWIGVFHIVNPVNMALEG